MALPYSSNPYRAMIDGIHPDLNNQPEPLSVDVWRDKYKWTTDSCFSDMCERVAVAINKSDGEKHQLDAFHAMDSGLWIPAGRILTGAGTSKRVTLLNCFVNATMEDSMEHIMDCMKYTALTMQQGGGMGTDFSPLRPNGAMLYRTHSKASGPLPFMDQMNAGSLTIRSAGDRRGAMMGTLCDTHPDLPAYIIAKREKGRLKEFNVSVLVSEALMEAVAEDEEWLLYFHIPPHPQFRSGELIARDFEDDDGTKQYVYSIWQARDLWDLILQNTYEYAEPGVLFIDRINELNNLQHVEQIRCTNPCGEQPLPPHGACDLGHINLARLVLHPFTEKATFNWELVRRLAKLGQRFLDNVLDVSGYPLAQQYQESMFKRRTGLGISGLADCLMQLRLRYGSPRSVEFAERVMKEICLASYEQNIALAIEKGPCPAMTPEMIKDHAVLEGTSFIAQRLPQELQDGIRAYGLRNGVALTNAPTGTTSIVFGNLDGSGCECAFAHKYNRKVRVPGGREDDFKVYTDVTGYTHRLWRKYSGDDIEYPGYFVTSDDLSVEEHVTMQAALQRWVDASISKTVNCPSSMTYAEFQKVYDLAYRLGCKGCTTYRPSETRGSILSTGAESPTVPTSGIQAELPPAKRPEILQGSTYQIKWPNREAALYLTLNEDADGYLREVLITSKDSSNSEWVTALTLMITAIFKKGGRISFVADELKQIRSVNDFAWVNGKHYGSLPAYIGTIIERHLNGNITKEHPSMTVNNNNTALAEPTIAIATSSRVRGEECPLCHDMTVVRMEGCKKCIACTWSSC